MARKQAAVGTKPQTYIASGVKWREHYNCYSALIGGWLSVSFVWGKDEYTIRIDNRHTAVVGDEAGRDGAAAAAVKEAQAMLRKALKELEGGGGGGSGGGGGGNDPEVAKEFTQRDKDKDDSNEQKHQQA